MNVLSCLDVVTNTIVLDASPSEWQVLQSFAGIEKVLCCQSSLGPTSMVVMIPTHLLTDSLVM